MKIELLSAPSAEEKEALVEPLNQHSRRAGFRWDPQPFTLVLRGADGAVRGGIEGSMLWSWMRIERLAVDESLRGRGWGRRLVYEAESLARRRGISHCWVDTFSFQAPGFYERLGFRRFAELEDFPPGERRLFYRKRL